MICPDQKNSDNSTNKNQQQQPFRYNCLFPQQHPSHNTFDINISNIDCPITLQQQKCLRISFSSFIINHFKKPNEQSEQILNICNHPILFKDYQNQKITKPNYSSGFNTSGKMIILDKLLLKLKKNGEKVVILTDTIEILEMIENYLITKNYEFILLDSNVRGENRQKVIDQFHSADNFFVFLSCFKSGLNGINLSITDHVIIYDSNESTDCIVNKLKSNGIGQKKKVEISRLVTAQSYEQVIVNYLDNEKDQDIIFTQKINKFLRLGAYFAFKKCDNVINEDDDIDSIISFSKKKQDINELIDFDIESPDFWEKLIPINNKNIYFNPENDSFKEYLNSKVYVDKSEMIYHINELLSTEQKCLCVTRPKKFGKTMAAKMLSAYYSKGCNSSELFASLKGSQTDGFYDHLNKHNVIYIDMKMIICSYNGNPEGLLSFIQTNIIKELKLTFPYIKSDILFFALAETKQSFIIIIDEWDIIYKEYKDYKNVLDKYYNFLIVFSKCQIAQCKIELVYMTGILPIIKHDISPSLNCFIECTMLDPIFMAPYFGFTEEEVKYICSKYQFDFNEMKTWYNGYLLNGIHIYNPKSVVDALIFRKVGNYWSETDSFESLKYYINMNLNDLRNSMIKVLANNRVTIDAISFDNDLNKIKNTDDVFTVLVHFGYLGFNETTEEIFIPNNELLSVFCSIIKQCDWPVISNAIEQSNELFDATIEMNADKVCKIIGKVHYESISLLKYNNENLLSCVISIAYFTARKFYLIVREMPLGIGFLDLVFIPKHGINKPAILFELKWNQDAESVINQIEQKKYSENLSKFTNNLIIVGVNYDVKTKKHECIIKNTSNNSF